MKRYYAPSVCCMAASSPGEAGLIFGLRATLVWPQPGATVRDGDNEVVVRPGMGICPDADGRLWQAQ